MGPYNFTVQTSYFSYSNPVALKSPISYATWTLEILTNPQI